MSETRQFDERLAGHRYQEYAVRRLRDLEYGAVFHEQGLGKTKIGLGIALHWMKKGVADTTLVVTKKMIVPTWLDEVEKHTALNAEKLGPKRSGAAIAVTGPGRFFVTNYEQLGSLEELLRDWTAARRVGVVLDESHAIKNPERLEARILMGLRERFTRRLIMTGTPSANRPYDLWNQIRFLDGGQALGDDFGDTKRKLDLPRKPEDVEGYEETLRETQRRIAGFTVRETKQSAGINLPDKRVHTWHTRLEGEQKELYQEYAEQAQVLVGRNGTVDLDDTTALLKRLGRMLECVANPEAVDGTYHGTAGKDEVLLNVLAYAVRGQKAIVWTGYKENAERLGEVVGEDRAVVIHGGIEIARRLRRLERFKREDGGKQLLVATTGSCKEGLTLTEARHVIYYDRTLSLDDYLQSQDRIHRISQTEVCHVHRIIASDTIDEWVEELLEAKAAAAKRVQGDTVDDAEEYDWTAQRELMAEILTRSEVT